MSRKILFYIMTFIVGIFLYQVLTITEETKATEKMISQKINQSEPDYLFYADYMFGYHIIADTTVYILENPVYSDVKENYAIHIYALYFKNNKTPDSSSLKWFVYFSNINKDEISLHKENDKSALKITFDEFGSDEIKQINIGLSYHKKGSPACFVIDIDSTKDEFGTTIKMLEFTDSDEKTFLTVEDEFDLNAIDKDLILADGREVMSSTVAYNTLKKYISYTLKIIVMIFYILACALLYLFIFSLRNWKKAQNKKNNIPIKQKK